MTCCPVCGIGMHSVFSATLLKKYEIAYERCPACGLLQTEAPYWLDEAYNDAISIADTGLVARNLDLAAKLAVLLYLRFDPQGAYLDVAGGYGMLARLMRDYGFDYYWDDKYCQNLLARGFEADKNKRTFTAVSAFEVLEHLHDPLAFIREQFDQHHCRTLIFTTELYAGREPPSKDWWYYTFDTGQHISFYQKETFVEIAKKLQVNFYSMHGIHILTDRQIRTNLHLQLATGRAARIAAPLIRRSLGSRTISDHHALMEQTTDRT